MDTVIIKTATDEFTPKKTKTKPQMLWKMEGTDENKIQHIDNQDVDELNHRERMIDTKPM